MGLLNLRNALMTGKRLPYDAEVEYLESSGTQRIDSGIYLALSDIVECTFVPKNRNSVFGIYNSPGNSFNLTGTGSVSRLRYETQYKDAATTLDEVHTVKCGNGEYWVDGVLKATISFTDDTLAATCPIFARKTNLTTLNDYLIGQIMSFKIIRNSVAIFDAIPVRKGTVGYLYDRVSGKLFGNAGTGDFVLGPDVVPVEYIESHGTEWIDTGINALSTTDFDFEITARFPSVPSAGYYGSGYTSSSGVQMFYAINAIATTGLYMACNSTTTIASNLSADKTSWHSARATSTDGIVRYYFDGVQVSSFASSAFTLPRLYLFAFSDTGGNAIGLGPNQISSFRFSANDTPIRSFLPVRVGTEGAMMDTLTRRIYRNAWTGAFTYGNDLRYPIPAE